MSLARARAQVRSGPGTLPARALARPVASRTMTTDGAEAVIIHNPLGWVGISAITVLRHKSQRWLAIFAPACSCAPASSEEGRCRARQHGRGTQPPVAPMNASPRGGPAGMREPPRANRRPVPLGRRPWFQAAMAVAALGLVAASVTMLVWRNGPPSRHAASNCGLINCGASLPGPSISTQSHISKAHRPVSHAPAAPAPVHTPSPSPSQAPAPPAGHHPDLHIWQRPARF
jgi:hypothetical protein